VVGRFGFFLYTIGLNTVHSQRLAIMLGHFDDKMRLNSVSQYYVYDICYI
jgi:hypothetical protein